MPTEYDKLVRDRIPAVIREGGDRPVTHVADDAEYERRLLEKLDEEVAEYRADRDPDELGDVLAVVDAIRAFEGISEERLADLRASKREARGGFEERVVLERVEHGEGTEDGDDSEERERSDRSGGGDGGSEGAQ